jgi:hypothetical protein
MPESTGEFISGDTSTMLAYAAQGPDPAALGPPQQMLDSQLGMAGSALVAADWAATSQLTTFVNEANAGFERLEHAVKASGEAYFSADEAATATITDVFDANIGP